MAEPDAPAEKPTDAERRAAERKRRLAAALRDNLRKRKPLPRAKTSDGD